MPGQESVFTTEPLVTEIMAPDRPHNALIYLAATSTDLLQRRI